MLIYRVPLPYQNNENGFTEYETSVNPFLFSVILFLPSLLTIFHHPVFPSINNAPLVSEKHRAAS